MSDTSTVTGQLDRLIDRLAELNPEPPQTAYDNDWPSACYLHQADDGQPVPWRPVRRDDSEDMFARLAAALEQPIHPDLVAYYCRYWSDPLPAQCPDGELSLLQVWNPDDMERLRGNLIGHALAKRKQRQPLTLFFATTEPDGNYFLSIDNQSGEVWLEQPGKKPLRKLADSLADFLATVEPMEFKE
ncbi:SecY-interacting protein [Marinobacterium arenosum]|uniref:SecY-interacting protein n=1 Tax=Marinobacterium arenosum TaxID=2862496 RepID=UPI001C940F2D|nr:SecY-interacting protein [Marinobacterium arenosum]MBY4677977.1 SecY-interacting protein [Marinobacterium arenosum]